MFLKLLFCFISLHVCVIGLLTVCVHTPVGQICGLLGEKYTMFLGIPYGAVDEANPFGAVMGRERLCDQALLIVQREETEKIGFENVIDMFASHKPRKNAKPHPYFKTPHEAFDDSSICPQYDRGIIKGTIQCLHLNIYKPNVIKPGYTLPVMVYIHGGAFVEGNGALTTYAPTYLMRHDVILVTVNYRLGPYGQLCLPNTEYSNQALKDQNLAFRWIKNNIRSFGGDSDNILLFGHSSGSVYVHFHLLTNKEILFNKVILQSGVALVSLVNQVTDVGTFVKDVGQDDENIDVERFIQTISAIDTETIINITKFYDFRPCIDGEFIRKSPNMRYLQNIKLMIGGTTKEMLYFYPRADSYDTFDYVAELNNGFLVSKVADRTDAIDAIKQFYLENVTHNFIDFASDLAFNYPMERTVRYYVQNKCTVYRYLFSYDGGRNYMKIRDNITSVGCAHGDELGYLFDIPLLQTTTREDQVIIDRMSLLWTNFAKYGDPTPTTSDLLSVKWTPVTAETKSYLQIDTSLGLYTGPFQKRIAFWDSFYKKYGMYAKGISLGENVIANRTCAVDLSKVLKFLCLLLLWQ